MNIVEPILFQAKLRPEAAALCAPGIDVVSYGRLVVQMNNIARRAISLGLKRGDVVILSINEPMLHAATILGLTQVGIITASAAMQKPPAGLKIDAVISTTNYPFAPQAQHLLLDSGWTMGEGKPLEIAPTGTVANEEICRIVLTSGATGDPKALALTHRLVMAKNARFEHVMGNRHPTSSRAYMLIGLMSGLGYQYLIRVLERGGTVFFRGDSVENTLRAFTIFQIQTMLATPTTLAQFVATCDRYPSIEISLDTIVSAGSLLSPQLAERIRPRICAHLITAYGASETSTSATAAAHRIAHIDGAAGYVTPGTLIEIVDDADRPLPLGSEGIVRVASEFGVDRYVDDPVESAKVFRNGWFYPGDIGSLTADNVLIISGRQNEVLNVGGGKLQTEKVEAVLGSFAAVGEVAVFVAANALGVDELWAAVVWRGNAEPEALRKHCRGKIPQHFVPTHIVSLDALPVTAIGKVDRPGVKRMLLDAARS